MIFIVDKPSGMTSQRVVAEIKHLLPKGTPVGHTGTLDPICTGILPVLTGQDTKLSDYFPKDKSYIAEIRLGIKTDTQDITGTVTQTHDVTATAADLQAVMKTFVGKISQIPPMYSAVRVDGHHLYELARKGIVTERQSREVEISSLKLLAKTDENTYRFSVDCSAGTYIRTLCDDIGDRLGCGGVMASLRRTRSNGFTENQAVTLEKLKEAAQTDTLARYGMTAKEVLSGHDKIVIPEDGKKYFVNGGAIAFTRVLGRTSAALACAYGADGTFLALAQKTPAGWKAVWLAREDGEVLQCR